MFVQSRLSVVGSFCRLQHNARRWHWSQRDTQLNHLQHWFIHDVAGCIWICTQLATVMAKMIRTLVFSATKNSFKSVISIFCCIGSVGNISLHFQTFIYPLIVIIQWDVCLITASAPHRDVIWSSSVCHKDMKKQNKLRQTRSRRTVSKTLRETSCKATELFKVLVTCAKMQ